MPRAVLTPLFAGLFLIAAGPGCDREAPIQRYTVPKDPPPLPAPSPPPTDATQPELSVTWQLPTGWRVQQSRRMMRFATLEVGDGDALAEISITRLGASWGDILDNVNRWRNQIGLPPIADHELDGMLHQREIDDTRGFSVTLDAGTDGALAMIVTALYRGVEGTWFCKMTGPRDTVLTQATAYETFMQSWQFTAAITTPAPATTEAPMSIRWNAPPGWAVAPNPGPMRLALFIVGTPQRQATASIARLAGDGGGTLDNVVRWRRQIGLGPVATIEEAGLVPVSVGDTPGHVVTMTGPGDQPEQSRIAFVARSGFTWFIKIRGPRDAVESHADAFNDFVASIRFEQP